MAEQLERRFYTLDRIQARAEGDAEARHIIGHAAVFETPTLIYDFEEIIAKGAFKRAILEDDVRALYNHDANYVLGRNTKGTLLLAEDDDGLAVDILMPDTSYARDLLVSMERGDVDQMSFAFVVGPDGAKWRYDDERKVWQRTVLSVAKLYDVSPVTYPAYPSTDAHVRAMGLYRPEPPQVQRVGNRGDEAQGSRIARMRRQLELLEMEL